MKKWRAANKFHIQKYDADHIENGRARARRYYWRNRQKRCDYSRRYAKENRPKIRAYRAQPHYKTWAKEYRERKWRQTKGHILKSRFGITFDQFHQMELDQNFLCAICGKPETAKNKWHTPRNCLSVDHCHKTGKVRGLLCRSCNHSIGRMGDDVRILQNAIDYLKKHSS